MPVISLSAQDDGNTHELPSLLRAEKSDLMFSPPLMNDADKSTISRNHLDSGFASHHLSHITPISPIQESPQSFPDAEGTSMARPIPPPPTPRRHRSGILMSRVRAHTGGNTFKSSSKSFGDLTDSALEMSDMTSPEAGPSTATTWSEGKRTVSAGGRARGGNGDDEDEDMWDNR